MISNEQVEGLMAASGNVLGPNGDKIGSVGTFYLDDQTNEPAWVTVNTGLFGTNETFVPLSEATVEGVDVLVPYSKDEVKNAPQIDSDGSISAEEEVTLYRYYGFTYDDGTSDADSLNADAGTDTLIESDTETISGAGGGRSGLIDDTQSGSGSGSGAGSGSGSGLGSGSGMGSGTGQPGTTGLSDSSGSGIDDAMTRSEEQLDVGTESRETGRARLRKYTVTETVTTQVPVSHEEVVVEREPITDANRDAAMRGPELREDEYEVTLHAEEPVVHKHTEPVERVRLDTETVTGTESVSDEVRKEKIDTEVEDASGRSMSTGAEGGTGSEHGSGHSDSGHHGSGHDDSGSGSGSSR
ncbi:YsnF/AvaK domain-containing protein [Arthrobacter koreensis]|uniref:YsnF/AvaK domain-containing protein n=1 Tax=Arthrobacter koreensis TaxID=199136 RepID=UPI002DBA5B9D|nr:YsnF/AvaK domain-containing protein [Arthrobacter koreensis]MEB7504376.1 YsnF/AvaK domain-containing protein [Arthrobacter koreensis]